MTVRGSGAEGGGNDDLAGHQHVLVGVPEEARLPVVGVLEMLGKSSDRIPRSMQACSDRYKVKLSCECAFSRI